MATYQRHFVVSLSLVLLGVGIILFSMLLIGCSFAINYDDEFKGTLEQYVLGQFDYYQYWAGIPFLATGVLVILSGVFQRSKALAVITLILCVVSMGLTLLVLSVSSSSFSIWYTMGKHKLYWESKDYSCNTDKDISFNGELGGQRCECKNGYDKSRTISYITSCKQVSVLSGLYGSLVVSSIIIAVCCVFSVIIIAKFSWKQKTNPQYTQGASHVNNACAAETFVDSELPLLVAYR